MAVRADAVMLAGGCALRRLGVSCCVIPELGHDIGFTLQQPGNPRGGGLMFRSLGAYDAKPGNGAD